MASTIRYEGHSHPGDGCMFERGFVPDRSGLEPLRLEAGHVGEDRSKSLSALIESEIIPRLMVAHANGVTQTEASRSDSAISAEEVQAFAPLALQVEADALLVHVEAILARGVAFETVLVDLLAPTARLLGEFWTDDRCNFVDVTMGLWRLQEVVHEISVRLPNERPPAEGARRALFASLPGEQHTFGIAMIDDVFRREGWLTDRLCDAELDALLKRAQDRWFDIIGLTVSCDCHIAPLPSVIAALRKISKNPQICVIVGGRILSADPDLAVRVGADGTAQDAKCATKVAAELVRQRQLGTASNS